LNSLSKIVKIFTIKSNYFLNMLKNNLEYFLTTYQQKLVKAHFLE